MPSPNQADLVLDTHVWVWLASSPERISKRASSAIDGAELIGLCPISCWEVATKVAVGKLRLDRDVRAWVRQALGIDKVRLVPLTAEIATTAGLLGRDGMHGDPADRLIAATGLHVQAPVISKDRRLRSFSRLTTVW